jgi:hypothetical protein
VQRLLIVVGLIVLAAGLLWPWLVRFPLGRLPGDILVEKGQLRLYIPITTGLLISLLISLILWLLHR